MKSPDHKEFLKAIDSEIKGQIDNENFTVMKWSQVPGGFCVLSTA